MAVTIQAGSLSHGLYGLASGTPSVYNKTGVTVAAGSDMCLFVLLSARNSTAFDTAGSQFETPKLDGVDMTLVYKMSGGANSVHACYYALNPSVGTHTVQLRTTVYTAAGFSTTIFCADGVDQTTPVGTQVTYTSGSSASPQSNNVTVLSGGMAIQAAAIYLGDTSSDGLAAGAGQTAITGTPEVWVQHEMVHSYKADATAMSYSWTSGGSPQNSQLIVPINPAAGGDTTAPTLSSATATATGAFTASGTVVTDEGNGTLYYYASTNATETAATIVASGSTQTVSTTGTKSVTFSSLSASTTYYAHYVQDDSSTNRSNVVSSASFATSAAPSSGSESINIVINFGHNMVFGNRR